MGLKDKFFAVFNSTPHPVILLDRDLRIDAVNRVARHLTGGMPSTENRPCSLAGAGGAAEAEAPCGGKVPARERFPWLADELQAFAAGNDAVLDFEKSLGQDPERRNVHVTLRRMSDADGEFLGAMLILADDSLCARAEDSLRERERKFRLLYEEAPLGYQAMDENGRLIEVNQAWLNHLGYSKEEVMGRWFGDFLAPPAQKSFSDRFPCLMMLGDIEAEEFEMVRKDGSHLFAEFHGNVVRDGEGRFRQTHCIMYDTTERRKGEDQLRESEERFRSAFEYAAIGMAVVGIDGRFLQVNLSLCRMLGYSMRELLQTTFQEVSHPEDLGRSLEYMEQMLDRDLYTAQLEKRYIHKCGHPVWVQLTASLVCDAGGKPLYFITQVQDITQRRKAEQELALLAAASEQTAESIAIMRTDGTIHYVNPAFERITGYERGEAIGRDFRKLRSTQHDASFYGGIWKLLARGETWTGRTMERNRDGTLSEVETTLSPIRNESGTATHYVAIQRDVTNERKMERQLRQAQKMEAIGTLAGGIAHDFNNILAAIIGYSEMALFKIPKESGLRRNMEQVLKAGDRAKELVKQILAFSRQREQELKPLQISLIIKEALKLMRSSLPSSIEITQEIENTRSLVWADPSQIHQVFTNLCTNAAHAMGEAGGLLTVKLQDVDLDSDAVVRYAGLSPGHYLRLTVSDTGCGMSRSVMARAFDPFFTTRGPGEGTGMGLAVVHGIVQSHRGTVTVYSEEGKGTTFHVFFPRFMNEVADGAKLCSGYLPRGNERVLLVDDEKALADTVRQMLEHLGYRVTATTSSKEALEIFREGPDSFDVLVTDQTMPFMTGVELAREVMLIRPEVPVILCSGLGETVVTDKAKVLGVREFLMKPMLMREIAAAMRRVLDGEL